MTGLFLQDTKKTLASPAALILVTSLLAVGINAYLLIVTHTAIFDPLFYIPIVIVAYYYPKEGISFAGAIAALYLLMVLLVPSATHETALASFGHAGIFILIGWAVSYLRRRYPKDIAADAAVHPEVAGISETIIKSHGLITGLIVVSTFVAFLLNGYLLYINNNLIFDPLFYFPVILIAYFYPRQGILATAGYALTFCLLFLLTAGSTTIVITGFLHAGILVIIGFVLSYIVAIYSHEEEIHKRLAELVESSSDAIIGKTLDGIITDWNRGAEHLYGYSAGEVVGKPISLLMPSDRPDELRSLLSTVKQGIAIERYETERVTKDKRRIWVSLAISPIRNEGDTVIGASVIAYDITDRKLAEDALTRANRQLQIFGSITRHDVLNQLTVLNIYHNLTESMIEDSVALSFLDKAKLAADAISRQIQFTHEYQEIGAKKPVWTDVHYAFVSAAALYKARPVEMTPCGEGTEIYADPLLMDVFGKLIEHSLTYGALVTSIRCSSAEDENGLLIVYEDNGIGIPAEDKAKVFDRASGDDPRLGLFLVREILSITNIAIAETGTPGKGARFEIRVPKGEYRFADRRP
jgi:PAS domain S-box-containing protein